MKKTFKTYEEIRNERARQRGNKEIYSLLGVVLAELDRRPDLTKEVSEQDIYKVIKKLYDAAIECRNSDEEAYLEQFIKKQMTEDELRDAVRGIIEGSGINNIGGIMKCLSNYYAGQYDGKLASQVAREILNS